MDAPEDRSKALNEHMILPQEQTWLLRAGTSASCHESTYAVQQPAPFSAAIL